MMRGKISMERGMASKYGAIHYYEDADIEK